MEASKIRQRIRSLKGERERLEQAAMETRGKLVMGSLLERYTECRKGNCKCTRGEPHGPFLYMAVYIKGKLRHRYVGKAEDGPLVEGLRRYKRFQSRLERIRKVNKELNTLWNELRKGLIKK